MGNFSAHINDDINTIKNNQKVRENVRTIWARSICDIPYCFTILSVCSLWPVAATFFWNLNFGFHSRQVGDWNNIFSSLKIKSSRICEWASASQKILTTKKYRVWWTKKKSKLKVVKQKQLESQLNRRIQNKGSVPVDLSRPKFRVAHTKHYVISI